MGISPSILIGLDMGKTTLSFAVGEVNEEGGLETIREASERHRGDPVGHFTRLYRSFDHRHILGIVATGVYSNRLTGPVVSELPEEIAQEYATQALYPAPGPITIIRLGGSGYSVLTRDRSGLFHYDKNDKCSAGTGETIEKIAGRMGLTLDQAMDLAGKASESIPITSRCSVFAKSEMTHFGNQGESHERLFRGYFESVAGNIHSLFDKNKGDGPVVLIGHGALIDPVIRAFEKSAGQPVTVSGKAGVYEAFGALCHAAGRSWDKTVKWPENPDELVQADRRRIQALKPVARMGGRVIRLAETSSSSPPGLSPHSPVILGMDLGSTGSKAVLIDADTSAVIADKYRRTDGNPVDAAKALVAEIVEMAPHPVVAVGLTGSGRDAAATVFRAAFPDLGARLLVQNEIIAHATAAIRYDPDCGKSLSIVEIGGQDAKFANVQGGRVVDSDMNRACSAGTGSFLEEQAILYGVSDIGQFGEMAAAAENPPDLGQMCTVFVSDLAAEAINEGFSVSDIFAGFQYSVIFNYKNRVMGNRPFMDRIFFQGKPASSLSLARTLAAVTGREVMVPPNPGAMGAMGIAMLAGEAIAHPETESAIDLGAVLDTRITSRRTFQCKDSSCRNLCRIESAEVDVHGRRTRVVSGGSCPKYEAVSAGPRKLPKNSPAPYREREELICELTADSVPAPGRAVIGIPCGHYLMDYLPFFHTLFTKLGAEVRAIRSGPDTLPLGNRRCSAGNACTPVKIMHGLARTDVDYIFMPKFVTLPRSVGGTGAETCPMTQALPELVEHSLAAEGAAVQMLRPVLKLEKRGLKSAAVMAGLMKAWKAVTPGLQGLKPFFTAYREALGQQRRFEQGLKEIGRRALAFAGENNLPVILVVGSSHVIHEPVMNSGIHEIVAENGAIALPLDCFEIPDTVPPLERVYWGTAGRLLRASLAAASMGRVFPLMIESYGCGPSSFVEQLFNDLLEHYPHTVLESDGHGGKAGYVTRVQAFLHTVRSYTPAGSNPVSSEKIERFDRFPGCSPEALRKSRIVVMTSGPNFARHMAAVLRASGYDAYPSNLTDPEGFRMGRESCSGKECLPHQLIWGSFYKFLAEHPPAKGQKTALLNVTGFGPCRNGMFPFANEIALEKLGLADSVEAITFSALDHDRDIFAGLWLSLAATDLLNQLRFHHRPVERHEGHADELFEHYSNRLEHLLVQPGSGKGIRGIYRNFKGVEKLLMDAAQSYLQMPLAAYREEDIRTVFLCGDILLRVDEWGSGDLARKLNRHGLRIVLEPFTEVIEYFALHRSKELVEMESQALKNQVTRRSIKAVNARLTAAVKKFHPWIERDDIKRIDRESRQLLDGTPISEAVPTMGSALLSWRTKPIDGVVVVGPWGCGPALISEAQLRRKTEIPFLFVYNDGDPIDQARVAGFAWRLRHRPKRVV